MNWTYHLPTEIVFGNGALDKLREAVEKLNADRILIVTGKSSMRKTGVLDRISKLLSGNQLFFFEEIEAEPSPENIDKGIKQVKENKIDLVIGLGGGSAMDSAKLIAMLSASNLSFEEYFEKEDQITSRLPLIAIPTTSGTGSEITPFSVVWDHKKKEKKSVTSDYQYPDIAILDPELTATLPEKTTAATGMDALSQAIEAYWSKNSQPVSDNHALGAVNLIMNNLEQAVKSPNNMKARENMMLGSLFAGLAFSNTRTTAVHSVSYPLTLYFGITHGHACGLTLWQFLLYNEPAMKGKTAQLCRAVKAGTIKEAAKKIEQLMKKIGLETRLSELGIREGDIDKIIENGFAPERVVFNPRKLTEKDLRKILEAIL